jgi:hypothetical protein
MKSWLLLLVPGFVLLCLSHTEMSAMESDSAATISVQSLGSPFDVYDRIAYLGSTPLVNARIDTGIHVMRYVPRLQNSWQPAVEQETLHVKAGDSIVRTFVPPAVRKVSSEPYGAKIYAGDSLVGETPALVALNPMVRTLRLVRRDYAEANVPIPDSGADLHVVLIPDVAGNGGAGTEFLANPHPGSNFPVYATAGVSVLAGVISAVCKIRADSYYDEYRNTGNAARLQAIHRLDTISGISLGIGEVSLGLFTYLLLTR